MFRTFIKLFVVYLFALLSFPLTAQQGAKEKIIFDWWANSGSQERLPLAFDDATITFTADQSNAQIGLNSLVTPKLSYDDDGKTHLVYQSVERQGRLHILTYDQRYGLSKPIGFSSNLGGSADEHHRPVIIKENDRLYIAAEQNHNSLPIGVVKNRAVGDDLIFEEIATTIGTIPTYPNIHKKGSNFINVGQSSDVDASFNKNTSADFESGWTTETLIATRDADEDEHYVSSVFNSDVVSDKLIIVISGRNDDVVPPSWFQKYLLKVQVTAGGFTIYNWDESFSKTSRLNFAELSTNFEYYNTGADTDNGYIPSPALDYDGNFYDVSGDGAGGYDFIYQIAGAAAPTVKAISLPGAPTIQDGAAVGADGQNGGCVFVYAVSSNEVYAFFRIDSGGFGKIFMYKTVDLGDTWTDEGDIFSDINDDIYGIQFPFNISSIPNNKNFVVVGTSAEAIGTDGNLYIKKAAFGTVQTETGDPYDVTAYTGPEYDALMKRSYYVETGKITNVGTGCTGLIDQSPEGQNATVAGSPTLDNGTTPTLATLDGVNDAFSIPITGLTALTEGTIIAVAKMRTGVAGNFLTASKNTVTNAFLAYGKSADEKTRFIDSNVENINGTDNVSDAFHIFVFVHQNGANSSVLHFIDGKLQTRTPVAVSVTEGRFFTALASVTHLEIGRLVRTSTGWYQFDIKHLAISSTPLNWEQLTKAQKYLSNKYSITLNSHFQ